MAILRHAPFVFRIFALSMIVIAIARPRSSEQMERVDTEGIDIILFIDLEKRLMEQKDVWLDNLRVVRTSVNGVQDYKLELTGRFLIREANPTEEYDTKKARDRIDGLLKSFTGSIFIKSFENVRVDPSNPRILKFDFTLVVNPDKPI